VLSENVLLSTEQHNVQQENKQVVNHSIISEEGHNGSNFQGTVLSGVCAGFMQLKPRSRSALQIGSTRRRSNRSFCSVSSVF
jgi:hypothetical protein